MELAGLACAQTVARTYPAASYKRVLVIIGPGNQVSKAGFFDTNVYSCQFSMTECHLTMHRADEELAICLFREVMALWLRGIYVSERHDI